MSSKLYWEPVPKPQDALGQWDHPLKGILARRFFNHDGSLGSEKLLLGPSSIPYFEGLKDGHVEGASEILEALKQHEHILIWIEN